MKVPFNIKLNITLSLLLFVFGILVILISMLIDAFGISLLAFTGILATLSVFLMIRWFEI